VPFERISGKIEGVPNAMKPERGKLNAVVRRVNLIGLLGWQLQVMKRISAYNGI